MLCDTLFPNDLLVCSAPILTSLTLYQRQRPFIGPYFRCTFCTFQHQFFCDTVVTTSTLSHLALSSSNNGLNNNSDKNIESKNNTFSTASHRAPPTTVTTTFITANNKQNVDDYCTFNDKPTKLLLHRTDTPLSRPVNSDNMANQYFGLSKLSPSSGTQCDSLSTLSRLLILLLNVLSLVGQLVRCSIKRATMSMATLTLSTLAIICHPYLQLTYLTLLAYWPSLRANLVFDDLPAIIENRDVKPESTSWTQIWFNDFWGTPLQSPFSHKSYRPLTVLTFRLNYIVHQLNPFGYHLVNLLLHSLVTVVFYRYCILFFNECNAKEEEKEEKDEIRTANFCTIFSTSTKSSSNHGISKNHNLKQTDRLRPRSSVDNNIRDSVSSYQCSPVRSKSTISLFHLPSSLRHLRTTSFFVAALFAVHPIHTDCVSSVVGRAELLSALFYLGAIFAWTKFSRKDAINSFYHYHQHRRWSKSRTSLAKSTQKDYPTKLTQLLKAIGFAFVGFLCKEQSIFVLIYLAFYELVPLNLTPTRRSNSSGGLSTYSSSLLVAPQSSFINARRRLSQLSASSTSWSSSTSISWSLSKCNTIILLAVSFLSAIYIRFALMNFTLPSFNRFDNPASRAPFPVRSATYAYQAVYHFWLLLFPFQLSCDWTHASIGLIDFSDDHFYLDLFRCFLTLMAGLTLLVVLLVLSMAVFIAQARKPSAMMQTTCKMNQFLVSFFDLGDGVGGRDIEHWQRTLHAILLTIIPFLPASNLFVSTGFVIAERILYLPSIGFLLLLGIGLKQMALKFQNLNCPFKCSVRLLQKRYFNLFHNGKSIESESLSQQQQQYRSSYACIFFYMIPLAMVTIFAAKTYIRSIDWTNEYRLYESGLAVNPRNTKLLNNLGRLHEKDHRIDTAIELYRNAIHIEWTNVRSHLNLGNSLIKINDKLNAEKSYRNALQQIEEDLWQNQVPIERKVSPSVNKLNNDFLYRSKLSPLYFTALVRLSELIGNDQKRKEDLRQIQEKMKKLQTIWDTTSINIPSNADRKSCGTSDNMKNRNANFEDTFQLNQLYNLAIMHYRIGHLKEALNYFEQVLTLNPHHEDSLLASARIIQDEGMHQLNSVAFDRLERLIELGKGDETVHFNQAMLAVKANKYTLARQLFTQAISKRPTFTEAHYNLALLLIKEIDSYQHSGFDNGHIKYNLEQAVKHLKKVLSINPRHTKSMLVLGDLYAEKLDQIHNARHYYQIVIDSIDKFNIRARHNLCVLWYKQNNLDRAIDCFRLLQHDFRKLNQDNIDLTINRISEQIAILIKTKENLSWTSDIKSIDSVDIDAQPKKSALNLIKHKQSKHHNRNESQKLFSGAKGNLESRPNNNNLYQPLMAHKHLSPMCLI